MNTAVRPFMQTCIALPRNSSTAGTPHVFRRGVATGGIPVQCRRAEMTSYLFSCEHATCAVPEAYRELFKGSEDIVQSTEGWEPGVLNLAQGFAMKFRTPLVHGDVTKLLIDLEQDGDERWSRFSMQAPETTRAKIADRHEKPFRTTLMQRIREDLRRHDTVLHVFLHTDPRTHGNVVLSTAKGAAKADEIASAWRDGLRMRGVDVVHHKVDDLPPIYAFLRSEFEGEAYHQLRIAVSQTFFLEGKPIRWDTIKKQLLETFATAAAA